MYTQGRNLCRFAWMLGTLFSVAFSPATLNAQTGDEPITFQQVATASNTLAPMLAEADTNHYLETRISELESQIESLQVGSSNPCHCQTGPNGGCSCQRCGWYGGAGIVWVKPHFKEAFEYSETTIPPPYNEKGTQTQILIPFEYHHNATGRYWLGFKNKNQMGIRANYWRFNRGGSSFSQSFLDTSSGNLVVYGAHAVNIMFPANIATTIPGQILETQNRLKTDIFNLYGTYDTVYNGIEVSAAAGLRFAKLKQNIWASVFFEGAPQDQSLEWFRQFKGVGPSVSIEGKKRLACTRFSAVASGGGGLLFGTKEIQRTVIGDQTRPFDVQTPSTLSFNEADEVVGIGELGLGLEWSVTLPQGCQLNLRGTYEGQLWSEGGAPTLGFLGFEGFGFQGELKR